MKTALMRIIAGLAVWVFIVLAVFHPWAPDPPKPTEPPPVVAQSAGPTFIDRWRNWSACRDYEALEYSRVNESALAVLRDRDCGADPWSR
jgi:hypothetical protein